MALLQYTTELDLLSFFNKLPYPIEDCLTVSNIGFFSNLPGAHNVSSLQTLLCYNTTCSSLDELLIVSCLAAVR